MKVSSTSYNNIPPIIENVRVVHPVTCTMLDTVSDLPFSVEKKKKGSHRVVYNTRSTRSGMEAGNRRDER